MKRPRHFRTSMGKRIFAMLIDFIPILLLGLFTCQEFFEVKPFGDHDPTTPADQQMATLVATAIMMTSVLLTWFVYGTLAESSKLHATFGKRLVGLRIRNQEGGNLTFSRNLARNFAKILSIAPAGIGLIAAFLTFNNRAWHDILAGAVVVEERH